MTRQIDPGLEDPENSGIIPVMLLFIVIIHIIHILNYQHTVLTITSGDYAAP